MQRRHTISGSIDYVATTLGIFKSCLTVCKPLDHAVFIILGSMVGTNLTPILVIDAKFSPIDISRVLLWGNSLVKFGGAQFRLFSSYTMVEDRKRDAIILQGI